MGHITTLAHTTQQTTNKLCECCVDVWCCPLAIHNVHTISQCTPI